MITDQETDLVYMSDLLKARCGKTYSALVSNFEQIGIPYSILTGTNDIWVRDFMPVQVLAHYFVQFLYKPDYLLPKKYRHLISEPAVITKELGIPTTKTDIILDGGNVVKSGNKVVLTTKIFKENPRQTEHQLIDSIKRLLGVDQVIVIPQEPGDFVGHSDGMVRFIDPETVLINKYPDSGVYRDFGYNLRSCLINAGLHYVELPYTAHTNADANDATGCYINYLEIGDIIFLPTFNQSEDYITLLRLSSLMPGKSIVEVCCEDLAKLGGVLNCATWNILAPRASRSH